MLQLLCLLCTLISIFPLYSFGRGSGSYTQGATGFGPNFSRVRAMERNMGADLSKMTRAPRPDALTMPQIACSSDAALLAEIKQCICQLRNLIETCACSQNEQILSELEFIVTKVEAIYIVALNTFSNTEELIDTSNTTASKVDLILVALGALSDLDTFVSQFDVLISTLDTLNVGSLGSLTDSIVALNSSLDGISSKIDVDINLDTTILSVVDKMDTQLDTIESLVESQQNCCSSIDAIESIVDKINTQLDVVESIVANITASCSGIDALTIAIESTSDHLTSLIDVDIAVDQIILSVVDKLDTQLDVVESIVANITASCSGIDQLTVVVESIGDNLASIMEQVLDRTNIIQSEVELLTLDLSLIPVIDSKADVLLFNVGSRSDFAFSQTDQLSTIDQINALDLTVIALLKTILADLHGL